MKSLISICLILGFCSAGLAIPISSGLFFQVNVETAEFRVYIDGVDWLHSSDFYVTANNKVYSSADKTLQMFNISEQMGYDDFGEFHDMNMFFHLMDGSKPMEDHQIELILRTYKDKDYMLFGHKFFGELKNATLNSDPNKLSSAFPSIKQAPGADLGYLAYGGIMFGDTDKKIGRWSNDADQIASGLDSGPLVLFDQRTHASVLIAPFRHFMAMSAVYTKDSSNETVASWGLMGGLETIPDNTHVWTMLYYSGKGINHVMHEWGTIMRRYFNKDSSYREADFTINYLGYWTDNGAYYYYLTEPNKTYEQTIIDTKAYADQLNIPYRYVQYDSWWYPKGPGNGVTEWVSMDSVFPKGLNYVWNMTGWPVAGHNRWWSEKTVYAKQNGGKYDFIVETDTRKAIPTDKAFWTDLLRDSKKWGLILYEQDWLNTEFNGMKTTLSDINLGREWLRQMGNGAKKNGMPIQYCMSPSRHALQSLEIQAVTQARASNDYQPGNDQWKIGVSSIFAHALDVAPFKDNFWSTTNQSDNPYGKTEPFPELQAAVATLSTGPVGPSDKIGCSDVKLIMKSVNAEGLILKPERPARAIDDQIVMAAFRDFGGEVWTTHSNISGLYFGIILAADFSETDFMAVTPFNSGFEREASLPPSIVFSPKTKDAPFGAQHPLILQGCTKKDFCLYYITPILQVDGKELIVYGEMSKWVPMSHQRVSNIEMRGTLDRGPNNVKFTIQGAVDEVVEFYMAWGGEMMEFKCTIPEGGSTIIDLALKKCVNE